jgi:HAMP domain-containing protein
METLVVLLAFCSMGTGDCDVVVQRAQQPFTSVKQCRQLARVLDANQSVQEQMLSKRVEIPGPWRTKVICGTEEMAKEVKTWLIASQHRGG